jgi:peptidoglycan/xylan/chitin deacetylase (PgdA/CDA1 family)
LEEGVQARYPPKEVNEVEEGQVQEDSINTVMERFASFSSDKVPYPHVHLSFDDHSITDWYTARGTLMLKKAKAVFYVDSWDELDDDDIDRLRSLRSDGHIIGCHGMNHIDALDYSKKYGIDAYIDDEIIPAMESMAAAGFSPTHFAFPNSSFDVPLYSAVSKLFCYVRPGNESHYYTKERMFIRGDRLNYQTETTEHRIRNGEMVNVLADISNSLKSGHGISLVFHDVRRIGQPKHQGTRASNDAFVTVEELDTILSAVNAAGAEYETFAKHCKVGKDSFDKPEALV